MKQWKCTVCGYLHEGEEPPEKCPVCGAGKEKFVENEIEENAGEQEVGMTEEVSLSEQNKGAPAILGKLTDLILENHLHPISVHTPNGIIPIAVVFLLLGFLFDSSSLISAAYFNMVAVLLAMPLVLLTGYLTWQKKYKGAKTSLFIIKIGAGCLATVILFGLVVWRAVVGPDLLITESSNRYLFLGWSALLLVTVGIAGYLGGKLVFANKKKITG